MPSLPDSVVRQSGPQGPQIFPSCNALACNVQGMRIVSKWYGEVVDGAVTVMAERTCWGYAQRIITLASMPLTAGHRKSPVQHAAVKMIAVSEGNRAGHHGVAVDIARSLNLLNKAGAGAVNPSAFTLLELVPDAAAGTDSWTGFKPVQRKDARTAARPGRDTSCRHRQVRQNPGIVGIDDRTFYLAVAAVSSVPELPPAAIEKADSPPALKPASRAACERRCGSDGCCDPSSKAGCGGKHCGRPHQMPTERK